MQIGFIVAAGHAAGLAQKAEVTLHDPALGQHDEALSAGWGSDHFHVQSQRGNSGDDWSLVTSVGLKEL